MATQKGKGIRIFFTGQTGLDKSEYLERVIKICEDKYDDEVILFNMGNLMYEEVKKMGGQIEEGKILNLSILRLKCLRRSVTKDIKHYCDVNPDKNIIINGHACFRWRHGLFFAFDFDMLRELKIDFYMTLIDDVDSIYYRILSNKSIEEEYTLNDILIWREEEIILTEAVALALDSNYYVISKKNPIDTVPKLLYNPDLKKAYLSFPITKAIGKPDLLARIQGFKELMAEKMIIWDPITIEERRLLRYSNGIKEEEEEITVETLGNELSFKIEQLESIRKDIDGQIIARDYLLINQSDMIITFIPEIEGEHDISAGCQTEMHYAFELPREVYVLVESEKEPSPWIQQHATKIFSGDKMFDEIMEYFEEKEYLS